MRDVEFEYGCFRCGAVRPPVDRNPDTEHLQCAKCGETSIVTFRQALDMLNNYYIDNKETTQALMEYDEYYPELVEGDDTDAE